MCIFPSIRSLLQASQHGAKVGILSLPISLSRLSHNLEQIPSPVRPLDSHIRASPLVARPLSQRFASSSSRGSDGGENDDDDGDSSVEVMNPNGSGNGSDFEAVSTKVDQIQGGMWPRVSQAAVCNVKHCAAIFFVSSFLLFIQYLFPHSAFAW
jgi:hypothetical protein